MSSSFLANHVTFEASSNKNDGNSTWSDNGTNQISSLGYSMHYFVYKLGRCVKVEADTKDFLFNASIVQLVLAAVGFIGAILTLYILTSKKLRSSTSVYLTALGFYDAIFTLSVIINTSLRITSSDVPWLSSLCACLWTFCVFTSAYAIVCVTAERSLSIAKPFLMWKHSSTGLAIKITIIIALIGVSLNIPGILDEVMNLSAYGNCQQDFNTVEITSFGRVYTLYISVPLNFVIPFFAVLIMNAIFVFAILASRRRRRQQFAKGNIANQEIHDEGLVRLVVVISTWYSFSWLLPGFYYVYKLPMNDIIDVNDESKLAAMSDTLIVANSAINSIVYFLVWRKFREACVAKYRKVSCGKRHTPTAAFHFKSKTRHLGIVSYDAVNPSINTKIDAE